MSSTKSKKYKNFIISIINYPYLGKQPTFELLQPLHAIVDVKLYIKDDKDVCFYRCAYKLNKNRTEKYVQDKIWNLSLGGTFFISGQPNNEIGTHNINNRFNEIQNPSETYHEIIYKVVNSVDIISATSIVSPFSRQETARSEALMASLSE